MADLGALLTGPSAAGTLGMGRVGANVATVGTETGVGFGTPGVGVTYGYGPLDFSEDYSQPWIKQLIRDSVDGAGLPSRRTVWEYGYPEPDGETSPEASAIPVRRLTRVDSGDAEPVSASGSAPARYPSTFNERFGDWRGLPGGRQSLQASRPIGVFANEPNSSMASSMRGFETRSEATSAASGRSGGLLGMIQDYMRSKGYQPLIGANRKIRNQVDASGKTRLKWHHRKSLHRTRAEKSVAGYFIPIADRTVAALCGFAHSISFAPARHAARRRSRSRRSMRCRQSTGERKTLVPGGVREMKAASIGQASGIALGDADRRSMPHLQDATNRR